MRPIRFGIMATGTIAHKMARTMPLVPDAQLVAVSSRTQDAAANFAEEFGIPRAYGSHEALLADPGVDAVYIASPHEHHHPMALAAIAAGKHVLCEKPLTLTARDSAELYDAAEEKGVFLMEAMWSRFIPATLMAKRWLAEGRLGELRYMSAAFGYNTPYSAPPHRILRADRAGGALYDVGVYAIENALDFFAPHRVTELQGMAALSPWGADGVNSFLLRFDGGGIASLSSAVGCEMRNDGLLCGASAHIHLYPKFYAPQVAELWIDSRLVERYEARFDSGFEFELQHTVDCIRAGKTHSDRMPPEDTLACAEIFEELMRRGFRA